jgi:DNA-binding TFAR19-related protein (PDSD5 family)
LLSSVFVGARSAKRRIALIVYHFWRMIARLVQLARAGKLGGAQVDEESVIKMLEEVSSQAAAAAGGGAVKKVTIVRRKRAGSSEDEEDF